MAVVSLYLGWLVAGRVLRPVHIITATARRLSQETLHERIGLTGPRDELKELADTFDAMLARLSSAFESQRRFIANASHELRSPLAEQRALVDVSLADQGVTREQLREAMERIRDATDESSHLIASLMALARSQRGLETREEIALAHVVGEALERAPARLEAHGIQVQSSLEDVAVPGDPVLPESIVGNLLDNAVRYNYQNGWRCTTAAPSFLQRRHRRCSSHSVGWIGTAPAPPPGPVSGCRSSARQPWLTAVRCTLKPARKAGWQSQ
jgi:signal transduction histidine kinase